MSMRRLARGDSPTAERDARRATWATVLGFGLVYLALATRLGLGVDGAHYALYGLHLDWSYFDHPPMIGWLQALMLQLSDSTFALRLVPIVLGSVSLLLTHAFARRLFPEESPWTAFAAVLLLQSALLFHLIFIGALPETPMLVFSLAAMIVLLEILDRPSVLSWLLLGLLLGLAGLSKYTAITLVVTVVGTIVSSGRGRLFATPGPWLAAALAGLVVSPVVFWNASHDWISFRYQLGHGTRGDTWSFVRVLAAQGAQLGVCGPGLYGFTLVALVAGWRERAQPGVRLTLWLVLPILALFGWASGYRMTLPHWTALLWAGAAPLTARWIFRAWGRRGVRVAVWICGVLAVIAVLVAFTHAFFLWMPLPDYREPLADTIGWEDAAQRALELRDEMAAEGEPAPRLFIDNWSQASRIAWYARPAPVVVLDMRFDQFDLWYGDPRPGDRGVLVTWSTRPEPRLPWNLKLFLQSELVEVLPVEVGKRRVGAFRFYACEGYRIPPARR